jgi:predicted alpha/beta-hydrolase family hydrolase
MTLENIAGIAHEPDGAPKGVVVLTHGAGGNRDAVLLQQLCDEWAQRGWLAVRYNLPYRRRRPTGLHPPGKPERARTEHLPDITVPTVFTHGTSDPFGTPDELRAAAALVTGTTAVVEIASARHDLRSKTLNVPALAVDAALQLLGRK